MTSLHQSAALTSACWRGPRTRARATANFLETKAADSLSGAGPPRQQQPVTFYFHPSANTSGVCFSSTNTCDIMQSDFHLLVMLYQHLDNAEVWGGVSLPSRGGGLGRSPKILIYLILKWSILMHILGILMLSFCKLQNKAICWWIQDKGQKAVSVDTTTSAVMAAERSSSCLGLAFLANECAEHVVLCRTAFAVALQQDKHL